MNITLKLYASLGDYLPPEAQQNKIEIDVPDGATIGEILRDRQVPLESCHLILVNGHYHHRDAAQSTRLAAGDTLAVWPPIAGG